MIVHESSLVCVGLQSVLTSDGRFQVITREPGGDPPKAADLASVSVVVADCRTGAKLAAGAGELGYRVLILTHDDAEGSIRRAIEAGARGYLLLSSGAAEVVRAIQKLHAGGTVIAEAVAAKLVDSFSARPLTLRETDVLRLVMLGLSDKAIARRLARSVGTVKTHVKSVLGKLNAAGRTEAVAIARRRGLVPEWEGAFALGAAPERRAEPLTCQT